MNTGNINYTLLQEGALIGYHLKPSDLPLHPQKIWKGRVIHVYGNSLLKVELLENGYHGLWEYVNINQIVAVLGE